MPLNEPEQAWLLETESHQPDPNPCVRIFGPGPEGKRCKECDHFIRKTGYSNVYFKCKLRGNTNGPATDHRANWSACAQFIP